MGWLPGQSLHDCFITCKQLLQSLLLDVLGIKFDNLWITRATESRFNSCPLLFLQGARQTSSPWLNCTCSLRETSLGSMLLPSKGWFYPPAHCCRRSSERCLNHSLARTPVQVNNGMSGAPQLRNSCLRTQTSSPLSVSMCIHPPLSPCLSLPLCFF